MATSLKRLIADIVSRCRATIVELVDWLKHPSWWPGTLWRYGRVAWVCRVAVVNAIAGGLLLAMTAQARDFFSDLGLSVGNWLLFFSLTFLWAWVVHASARRALLADDWVPEAACGGLTLQRRAILQDLFGWPALIIPRFLGLLIFLFILCALAQAYTNLLPARDGLDEAARAIRRIRWLTVGTIVTMIIYVVGIWTRRKLRNRIKRPATPEAPLLMGIIPFPLSLFRPYSPVLHPTVIPMLDKALLVAAVVITVFFAWAFLSPHYVAEMLPRVLMVPVLLGGVVLALGEIGIWSLRQRMPFLLVLFGAAVVFLASADRFHDIRFMKAPPAAGPAQGDKPQIDVSEAVRRWKVANDRCGMEQGTPPCPRPILIAGAGGASRAAFMTATVVGAMIDLGYEKNATYGNIRSRIFAMSTVSGSSLGAVVMRAALADTDGSAKPPCQTTTGRHGWFRDPAGATATGSYRNSWRDCFQLLLSGDYLSPVLIGMFYRDNFPISSQSENPMWADRAVLLEQAFERHYAKVVTGKEAACGDTYGSGLCRPFGWHPEPKSKNEWLPLLFINGTSVTTGRRVIASDVKLGVKDATTNQMLTPLGYDLRELREARWEATQHPENRNLARNIPAEIKRKQEKDGDQNRSDDPSDIRLSTAATVSARFPLISPQGNIRSGKTKIDAIVDGGYFENDGLATVAEIAKALKHDKYGLDPVVIRIVNEPEETADTVRPDPERPPYPRAGKHGYFEDISSIVRTLITTREGHLDIDRAELVRVLGKENHLYEVGVHELTKPLDPNPLCRWSLKNSEKTTMHKVSMSWWMSQPVQAYLDAQMCLPENAQRLLCELEHGTGAHQADCPLRRPGQADLANQPQ